MAPTYRLGGLFFVGSQGMVSFYTRNSLWFYPDVRGWAVLEYAGSEPILQFGRGISISGKLKH